jgi:Cu(I)/Ag(I) efflux system membrane fusion protein
MEGGVQCWLALSTLFGLKTQVNVSYAKSLKNWQSATVSLLSAKEMQAKISFINPEINLDPDCYWSEMEIANQTVLKLECRQWLTQSNKKGLFIPYRCY